MDSKLLKSLHTNQRLFVEELLKRGAEIKIIDHELELLEVKYNGRTEFLFDRFSSAAPFNLVNLTAKKYLVKKLLYENGMSVPIGEKFKGENADLALEYAESIGYPVVFKPNWGSYGNFVTPGIVDEETLSRVIHDFIYNRGKAEDFLIEKHITGREYRIFITSAGKYAIIHREPAYVIGNGHSTINELATAETKRRIKLKVSEGTSLCPILIDETVVNFLKQRNQSLEYIPKEKEKVYLRYTSNLALGGVSIDATEKAHVSVIEIAKQALSTFSGMPCVGIDFITQDITADQSGIIHAIIEVNSNPGLTMHMQPAVGKPQNVASYLADVMFPDL